MSSDLEKPAQPTQSQTERNTARISALFEGALRAAQAGLNIETIPEPAKSAIAKDGPLLCQMIARSYPDGKIDDNLLSERFQEGLAFIMGERGQNGHGSDLRYTFLQEASLYM